MSACWSDTITMLILLARLTAGDTIYFLILFHLYLPIWAYLQAVYHIILNKNNILTVLIKTKHPHRGRHVSEMIGLCQILKYTRGGILPL